jgi:hypothetical protein
MRFSLLIVALTLTACASQRLKVERGLFSPDTMVVKPVKNLSGVRLKVPEIYMGDAGSKAAGLDVGNVDLAKLAEAGIYSHLDDMGYRAELESGESRFTHGPKYEVHSAITLFDMTQLRETGEIRMAMTVMLVDSKSQTEIGRGSADRTFRLLDMAPDEAGALGEERFIRARLEIFAESLASEAVDDAGF